MVPTGPLGRAKGLLDALHGDRSSGPRYRDFGYRRPSTTTRRHRFAALRSRFATGHPDLITCSARNSRSKLRCSPWSQSSRSTQRHRRHSCRAREDRHGACAFARAVHAAFACESNLLQCSPAALVVRHLPQRDEDNAWSTWVAAVCGVRFARPEHWAAGAPLEGWVPASIASLSDDSLA